MSYFQPFIASAFSTYAVSRSAYAGRAEVASQDETQDANKAAVTESGRDAGKPRSESGDILDLTNVDQTGKIQDSPAEKAADGKADAPPRDPEAVADRNDVAEPRQQDDVKAEEEESETTELETAQSETEESALAVDLTPEEQEQVEELKARDTEVRVHEAAHLAAAGAFATSGASYTYQTGPDGQKYAVGGEVGIDTGEVAGDPQATIQKMQTVYRAAMAPAEPSSQDYKVAAAARQKEAQARTELARQSSANAENAEGTAGDSTVTPAPTVRQNAETARSAPSAQFDAAADSEAVAKSFTPQLAKTATRNSAYQAQSTMPLNAAFAAKFSAFA